MQLTAKKVAEFIGGDLEVQSAEENYLYRGPIESATIRNGVLKVHVEWRAENDGGPRNPTTTWTMAENLPYEASLQDCTVLDIGEGRILLGSSVTGEVVVLFPPGGIKLDRSQVIVLAAAT